MLSKKILKLKNLLITLLLIHSNYTIAKKIDNINDIYIFGDSLSYSGIPDEDYGHLRFIPGGSLNPNYVDLISMKFTNKKAKNYLFGGTSYAQPGTKITVNNSHPELQTDKNIDTFLQTNNFNADQNSIYLFEIGGGDINQNITDIILADVLNIVTGSFLLPYNLQIGSKIKNNSNNLLLNHKPKTLVNLINKISNDGAKDIIFMNIPDASLAPIMMLFHVDILLSAFFAINVNLEFIKEAVGKVIDAQLRPLSTSLNGKDAIKELSIKSYEMQFPFIPKFIHEIFYNQITDLVSNATLNFNTNVYNELSNNDNSNLNILYLDLQKLFTEIIDNPTQYGIDNIVISSCTLGVKASYCVDESTYHTNMNYLFGDWFHASEYGHKIIANYIISTFNASVNVYSIARHLYSQDISSNLTISNQLNNNRIYQSSQKYIPFISYSASFSGKNDSSYNDKSNLNNNLNLGFLYNLNEKLALGAMFTSSLGKYKPFNEFKYNYNLFDISLFTQYLITDKLWVAANTGLGYLKAKDIKRTIDFGTGGNITETSSTHANSYNVQSLLGYDFKIQQNYILSPIIGYTYGKYKVKGFKENGNRSTSMYFKTFNKEVSLLTGGLQFNAMNNNINFNAQITYNTPLNSKETKVKSAINGNNILFERRVDIKNDKYFAIKLGVNKIFKKLNFSVNTEYRNTAFKNNRFNYTIGVSNKF